MSKKELSIEDFASLIAKMSEADKIAAYNVLYGMILGKTTNESYTPDPNVA